MSKWVDEKAKRTARTVNLYDFLLYRHPGQVEQEGDSLRLLSNHSVSIKRGYCGFMDFSDGTTGNSVDALVRFLGYGFTDAVAALCQFAGVVEAETVLALNTPVEAPRRPVGASQAQGSVLTLLTLPKPLQGLYRQLYAYLTRVRKIPAFMIRRLVDWGLLYQEEEHANMVFIDPARTFVELRGSNSFKPFHRVDFSDVAAFWWFKADGLESVPTVAYVCEGAVDAISLYLLRMDKAPATENGLYCSIGGVANQQRIDRIKAGMFAGGCQTVIAVDNDAAGEKCRQRNLDCKAIVPQHKDWNEDLIAAIG